MKSKILALCLLSFFVLTACKNESLPKEKPNTTKLSKEESVSTVKQSSSETISKKDTDKSTVQNQESEQNDASYNGSYYYVKGKHGEVPIVNKKHPVAADYAPGEDTTALSAFQELLNAMRNQGFNISNNYSGFRSYDTQKELYNNYVASDGKAKADRYSAQPGYSEHQTGLAFDILDNSGQLLTEEAATSWLAKNAHKYGFVVRYLEGKEDSTGYMPESWHVRYIGPEAQDIYESGQTLEEYYGVRGGRYYD